MPHVTSVQDLQRQFLKLTMASAPYSPFVGPMFEVIAGLDHKCFLVHASVLFKSDLIGAFLVGNSKALKERKIVLHDWDQGTVGRLVEWLYTGDYGSPCPTKVGYNVITDIIHQATALDANKAPIVDTEDPPQPLTPFAKKALDVFKKNFHESSTQVLDRWLKTCKHDPHELNFETTLLAHAKVYSLAQKTFLADLQALAFQHLDSLFDWIDSRIVAKSPIVSDLVTLTEYVYANTNRPKIGEEPLRDLLTTLIAKNFGCFNDGEKGQVRRLMDGGGDFGTDVWEKVGRHVGALGKDLRESHENIASLETELSGYRKKRRIG